MSLQVKAVLVFGWRECIKQFLDESLPLNRKLLNA
jgi:hypothetical protein